MRLLTNNPRKIVGLEAYGLKITERVSIQPKPKKHNIKYLQTKKEKVWGIYLTLIKTLNMKH